MVLWRHLNGFKLHFYYVAARAADGGEGGGYGSRWSHIDLHYNVYIPAVSKQTIKIYQWMRIASPVCALSDISHQSVDLIHYPLIGIPVSREQRTKVPLLLAFEVYMFLFCFGG